MTPRFSATKTRPSAARRRAVGFVGPLNTPESEKPAGRDSPPTTPLPPLPPALPERGCAKWSPINPVIAVVTKKIATRVAMNFLCPLDGSRLSIIRPRASALCTPPRPEEPLTNRSPNISFYGNDPDEEAWTDGDYIESAVAVCGPTPAERP